METKTSKTANVLIIIGLVVIIIVTSVNTVFLINIFKNQKNTAEVKQEQTSLPVTSTPVADTTTKIESNEVQAQLTTMYYTIGGSFQDQAGAESYVKKLKELGYENAGVIQKPNNDKLFYSYYNSYTSKGKAYSASEKILYEDELSCWVLPIEP